MLRAESLFVRAEMFHRWRGAQALGSQAQVRSRTAFLLLTRRWRKSETVRSGFADCCIGWNVLRICVHGRRRQRPLQPGTTASFIDMLPDRGTSTFVYANAFLYYHGSAGASRDLHLGGQVAANVKSTVYADTSIFLYEARWTLLGGQYAAALAVPYVWLDVKANLLLNVKRFTFARQARGTDNGFGDVELLPLMFGWIKG